MLMCLQMVGLLDFYFIFFRGIRMYLIKLKRMFSSFHVVYVFLSIFVHQIIGFFFLLCYERRVGNMLYKNCYLFSVRHFAFIFRLCCVYVRVYWFQSLQWNWVQRFFFCSSICVRRFRCNEFYNLFQLLGNSWNEYYFF